MANEGQVRLTLTIQKTTGNVKVLDYQSRPNGFNVDINGTKGPAPGCVTVTTTGIDVDLSQFTTPGLVWLYNMDSVNYVTYGIYDPNTRKFFPIGEILPGEVYLLRLSRSYKQDYTPPGTGTSVVNNTVRFYAHLSPCVVRIDAFEA